MNLVAFLLLVSLSSQQAADSERTSLEQQASQFWDFLTVGDKASALKLVHPDDVNNFINRREQAVLSWRLVGAQLTGQNTANVFVQLEQMVAGNRIPVPRRQEWHKTDEGWRVRILAPEKIYQRAREAFLKAGRPTLPKELSVYPQTLKIYQMARPKVGSILVRNGLTSVARFISCDLDSSRFKVKALPKLVNPGESARIWVSYLGEEQDENLESQAVLLLEQDGENKRFEIPIIYNYTDEVTRWLSRQAPEEMERLKKQSPPEKVPPPHNPDRE